MISNFANYICRYTINNRKNILKTLNSLCKTVSNSRHVKDTVKYERQIESYAGDDNSWNDNENIERIECCEVHINNYKSFLIKQKRKSGFLGKSYFHIEKPVYSHTITLFMSPLFSLSEILKKLPSLQTLVDEYGDMSLYDYASESYHPKNNQTPLWITRKKELLDTLNTYLTNKFDSQLGQQVCESLGQNFCVSTAEHHGPMGHPFFFQSALLRWIVNPDTAIVNFCTSHVSLGNSSYPRGIVFHGDGPSAPEWYIHLPLFSANQRMCPVFRLSGYSEEIQSKIITKIEWFKNNWVITNETFSHIRDFASSSLFEEKIVSHKTYSQQITQLNAAWWKSAFPDMPNYIPLDAEDIICDLLQNHLHTNSIISRILTDHSIQPTIEQYFNGISCCFDLANKAGTYLFWYLDEDNVRHSLWRDGEELVSTDKSFRVRLEHEELDYHLSHRHLIPSGFLVYTTLACYYGLTCFGGFAQGNYLPKIQKAYWELLETLWISEENLSTQSALLNEDMIFLYEKKHQISTALDLLIQWAPNVKNMSENAKNTTIQESLMAMVPEIGRCLSY